MSSGGATAQIERETVTLRPAMQLRFRDTVQFERVKQNAAKFEKSVNEYVLLAIEWAEEAAAEMESAPVIP